MIRLEVKHKIGESAIGLNSLGLSKRAKKQTKGLFRETGDLFTSEIMETLPGKLEARQLEIQLIRDIRVLDPKALPGNKGVH